MFPRRKRLARVAFPVILKDGRRFSSPHFSIVISNEASGYAVVVPKKVARLATVRNRMRRHVLAALKTLPLPPALIVFPKTSVDGVSYQEVQQELATLLSKNN